MSAIERSLSFGRSLTVRKNGHKKAPLSWRIRNAFRLGFLWGLLTNYLAFLFSRITGIPTFTATLKLKAIKANGQIVDYGIVGRRVLTDAFVNYVTDSLQDSTTTPLDAFVHHASGTDSTAEAAGDTALGAEVESRVSGTQTEGASANIFQSEATIPYTGTLAIVEHGLFSAATVGTLMDRTVFAVVNVENGESITFTYELTSNSGGA